MIFRGPSWGPCLSSSQWSLNLNIVSYLEVRQGAVKFYWHIWPQTLNYSCFISFVFVYLRWRGRWEGGSGWGIHVYPWLVHVNVWQKPLQYCKVISLQLKKIKNKKKKNTLIGPSNNSNLDIPHDNSTCIENHPMFSISLKFCNYFYVRGTVLKWHVLQSALACRGHLFHGAGAIFISTFLAA